MTLQLTRKDWEISGPYIDCLVCPMAVAGSRVLRVRSYSAASRIIREWDSKKDHRMTNDFAITQYQIAKFKYERGDEILFETEIL